MNTTNVYLRYLLDQEEWTDEEKEWMLRYLEGDNLSELETIAANLFEADQASGEKITDRQFSVRVLEKIHRGADIPSPSRAKRVWLYRVSIAAAVAAIVVGSGYFLRLGPISGRSGGFPRTNGFPRTKAIEAAEALAGAGSMLHAVTTLKERKAVQLPDGTQVWLEGGTVLDYPSQFGDRTRDIYLKGEAFFEVKKDEVRPFVVHTRFLHTTVLGTSFNVDASIANETRVVVVTGKIKVQVPEGGKDEQQVEVEPRQQAVYYVLPDRLEKQDATQEAIYYQQRRNGSFVYSGVSVSKVLEDMQRFYHTRLVLQGQVQRCIFHGHFHTSDDIEKALSLIAIPLNANIRKDSIANAYIIYGGSCQ